MSEKEDSDNDEGFVENTIKIDEHSIPAEENSSTQRR
jgi:hypothetical protein